MKSHYIKKFDEEYFTSSYFSDRVYRNKRFRKNTAYRYALESSYYCRHWKTMNERRENSFVGYDEDCVYYKIKVRGSRICYRLNYWNDDRPPSPNYGRSWKEYTRYHKQWRV